MVAPLTLIGVTAIYGWTFVVVRDAISQYPVLPFLGLRFGLAAIALGLLHRRWPRVPAWRLGLPIGLALALGYLLQTEGMVTVAPGIAGLITGLFVVFTPVLDRLLYRVGLRWRTGLSALVALAGTALLTGAGGHFDLGDLMVLGSAIAFSAQMVLLSHSRSSPQDLGLIQMLTCAVVFLLLGTTAGVPYPAVSSSILFAIVVTGLLASALAVLAQTWAQQRMSASRAGLVMAAEPAFALLFAFLLAGERLSPLQLLGAAILLLAIAGHEILSGRERA